MWHMYKKEFYILKENSEIALVTHYLVLGLW